MFFHKKKKRDPEGPRIRLAYKPHMLGSNINQPSRSIPEYQI